MTNISFKLRTNLYTLRVVSKQDSIDKIIENSKITVIMSIFGININHDLKIVAKKSIEWQQDQPVVYGSIADQLGAYEDIGTIEELRELKARKIK